jgi:MFS family permease
MISDFLAEKLGRRYTLMIADLFLIGGSMTMSVSLGPMMLGMGRLLVGFGLGLEMNVAPIFLAESSPIPLRPLIV